MTLIIHAERRVTGVGRQLCYLGFDGSAALETEAGIALVHLERAAKHIASCRLEIATIEQRAMVFENSVKGAAKT